MSTISGTTYVHAKGSSRWCVLLEIRFGDSMYITECGRELTKMGCVFANDRSKIVLFCDDCADKRKKRLKRKRMEEAGVPEHAIARAMGEVPDVEPIDFVSIEEIEAWRDSGDDSANLRT